jgi:Lipocalin-like domain
MKRLRVLTLTTVAVLLVELSVPPSDALGQQKTLKEQLVGTWSYVSVDTLRPDGSREQMYGPNPKGLVIFDSNGRYALVNARSDLAKFASNNRTQGTAEENKAVVQGSIAHFGRYTVNEADRTITFYIEGSTFPNWSGIEQKRPFTVTGDELKWTTPASGGGLGEVVLKRAK